MCSELGAKFRNIMREKINFPGKEDNLADPIVAGNGWSQVITCVHCVFDPKLDNCLPLNADVTICAS